MGKTRIERTIPFLYSATDWLDVGTDNGPSLVDLGPRGNAFIGVIHRVVLETELDHFDDPVELMRARLAVE